ncbi:MAG: radical SAM protein [Verrucomicrobiia bacterium]|jgi:radical SAM superfamily enzyme YgiQ (UPF0313 family)
MKILLVLPAAESVRVTQERPAVTKRAMLRFSILPLTTVAALTPREHPVRIVDENVEALDFNADVDVVGVTFMTALAPRAYEIAREFQARGKVVVAGGYHATLCTQDVMPHFDAVVVGDAEGAWPQVLRDIEAGCLERAYRQTNQSAELRPPVPRRDLLASNAKHYVTLHAVQTGRGCPHGCRYCSITTFHQRKHRQRPLADVLAELRGIPRNFMFVDDNIISDRRYALELFGAMTPLRKRWVSQCSIEIADDPELLRMAYKAGCRGLFIGIESMNADNLAAMGKAFNNSAQYRDRLARIRRAGIGIIAGIIVGMDKDTVGVFERTLEFLDRTRIDSLQLNILTPLPGTPLFVDMEHSGRVADHNWSHYDFRHVVFRPANMTAQELQDGADWLYAQFYRLDRILLRFWRGVFAIGWMPAFLSLKLNFTYRYDNQREGIVGRNPARAATQDSPILTALHLAGLSRIRV